MTLLDECKKLWSEWDGPMTNELKAIIARHEHDDWKGPYRCDKCGVLYMRAVLHYGTSEGCLKGLLCTGTLVPHERRRAERRRG